MAKREEVERVHGKNRWEKGGGQEGGSQDQSDLLLPAGGFLLVEGATRAVTAARRAAVHRETPEAFSAIFRFFFNVKMSFFCQ